MTTLSGKQIKAAQLLATGMKSKDIALAVKVTPETISHWKNESAFEAYFNSLCWEMMESNRERTRSLLSTAIDTTEDIMKNSKSDAIRQKAALAIISIYGSHRDKSYAGYWELGEQDKDIIEVKKMSGQPYY